MIARIQHWSAFNRCMDARFYLPPPADSSIINSETDLILMDTVNLRWDLPIDVIEGPVADDVINHAAVTLKIIAVAAPNAVVSRKVVENFSVHRWLVIKRVVHGWKGEDEAQRLSPRSCWWPVGALFQVDTVSVYCVTLVAQATTSAKRYQLQPEILRVLFIGCTTSLLPRRPAYTSQFESPVDFRHHADHARESSMHMRPGSSALHIVLLENWNLTALDYLQRRKCKILSLECLRHTLQRCVVLRFLSRNRNETINYLSTHIVTTSGLHSISLDYTVGVLMFCI